MTDYYLLDTYERVRAANEHDGRLPGVDLIFPNAELRLAFDTVKGNWVNCHLLVNPQDPDHVGGIQRFLAQLTFEYSGDRFACTPDELARLGTKIDPTLFGRAALARGATQFKASFDLGDRQAVFARKAVAYVACSAEIEAIAWYCFA
ncbi:hypothetical protein [Brucella sp. NBRC 12950]|uniref:hypothetical protein n=1 Tax=Brucella sp. NBRC 12950 TaxID=2994518 RepID=UPI0024A10B41|nr:hypothetical protein [Brucella sp. NBRC 12950]GLU28096.1 hypothetical protein Brsp01_33290 [Brucella sp. NBRC 12950]